MTVHYSQFDSPIGRLILTTNEHAVTGLYFSTGAKARSEPDPQWRRNDQRFDQARRELKEYFAGDRQQFELALEPAATPFTAATIGIFKLLTHRYNLLNPSIHFSASSGLKFTLSFKSWPAQNALSPSPVIINASISGSEFAFSKL